MTESRNLLFPSVFQRTTLRIESIIQLPFRTLCRHLLSRAAGGFEPGQLAGPSFVQPPALLTHPARSVSPRMRPLSVGARCECGNVKIALTSIDPHSSVLSPFCGKVMPTVDHGSSSSPGSHSLQLSLLPSPAPIHHRRCFSFFLSSFDSLAVGAPHSVPPSHPGGKSDPPNPTVEAGSGKASNADEPNRRVAVPLGALPRRRSHRRIVQGDASTFIDFWKHISECGMVERKHICCMVDLVRF
jgi:hypothetical protein